MEIAFAERGNSQNMWRGLFSQLVDEIVANILVYGFFRSPGRKSIVRGPTASACPALYSGDLTSFFAPKPTPVEFASHQQVIAETASQKIWDVSFPSETVTRWPQNDCIRCRRWQPTKSDTGLTVIGTQGIVQVGHDWFICLAEHLVPHGIDLVMFETPFNYRRTPPGYRAGELIVGGDMAHQLAVTRQGVLDLWRIVMSLQREGRRVGLLGVSYGGWLSLLTSLLAEQLEFVIAVVPPVDIVRALESGGTIQRTIRRGLGSLPIDIAELKRIARPVVPANWMPRLPAAAITLHGARFDRFVSCTHIEELARHWGARLVLHNDGHCRPAISDALIPQLANDIVSRPQGEL